MRSEIPFEDLGRVDIEPGVILKSGHSGHLAGEPINRHFQAGNMGGFRILGGTEHGYKLAVLYTTFDDPDWPDTLDLEKQRFTYYGDNKSPGRYLLDTPKHGNRLLQDVFEIVHARPERRSEVPPLFVTSRAEIGRDVVFHGVAAPGAVDVPETTDLVAIWKTKDGERFQNYRAIFTILTAPTISIQWIRDLREGRRGESAHAPEAWRHWVDTGEYN